MIDPIVWLPALLAAAVVVASLFGAAIKVVQEYERGVLFRLGRLVGPRGGGGGARHRAKRAAICRLSRAAER